MKKETPSTATKRKKALIIAGAIAGLYVVSLVIPGIYPFTRFPLYAAKCGHSPVIAYQLAGRSYITPQNKQYGPNYLVAEYFCTEGEAQAAGYSKSSVDGF
ncbi:MAG TPA: hypothetical protein VFO38_00945 [Candidatus Saccharimonadales bacterium]|nr:hypothetical protein [Candidatus Saccharimonadales bacterium]